MLDDISGSMALSNDGGTYLLFHKVIGDGAGFSSPYQRIGMRHKLWDFGTSHLFGETHFLINDHSRVGVNIGGGYRWLSDGGVLGVHGWYDSIETTYGNRFQSAVFGFEALHSGTDLRGNVYIPVGEDEGFVRVLDVGTQPIFTQNIFGTLGTGLFERNTTAFDLEAGTAVPGIDWLRMYAGPYFMSTDGKDDTWGVRARAEARFSRDVNLNVMVTDDNSFGTNVNLGVEVKFSGGLPTQIAAITDPYDRRYDQVRRQWGGQVRQIRNPVPVPLRDPRDGLPLNIVWVDNTNGAPGTGTFEDPFQMLPDGADGADYILVRTGVGDTTGNIVLQNDQYMFGEGKQFSINTDRLGMVPIPEMYFANSGPRPTLVGTTAGQNVITLADGNFVSNFDIFGGTAAAIGGSGITDFHIECIAGTARDGINIVNYTGMGVLRDSDFFPSAGGRGVFISNTGGGLLDIDDVTTDGGAIGMHLVAQNDPFGVTIDNYTGDNHTDTGLVLEAMGGEMIAEVTDASIFNSDRGYRLDVTGGGRLDVTMQDVVAEGTGNLLEGNVTDGMLNADVTNATLAGSTGGSGVVLNLFNATGVTTLDTIDASGNAVDGVRAIADGGSVYSLNVLDSNVSGNVDDNIQTDAFGGSTLTVFVDPTDASGAVTGNGYEFSVDDGSTLLSQFLDVDLSGNNLNAVQGTVDDMSTAILDFDLFDASQSVTGAGMNLFVNDGSTVVGSFDDGNFDNSATANILANVLDGSSVNVAFNNVTADGGATLGGFVANAIGGSNIASSWTNGSISNTGLDGVSANLAGPAADSRIDLVFDNVAIDGNAMHGIDGMINADAQDGILTIDLANSSVDNNTGDGINLDLSGADSITQVDIAGTTVTGNGDDGLEFAVVNASTLTVNATDGGTDFSDNGAGTGDGSAFDGLVVGPGSSATLNIDGANADRSGGNGAQFVVDMGGSLAFNYSNGSISDSGGTGVASTIAGGSVAVYNISDTSLNNNAGVSGGLGDGFQVIADEGSTVFANFNEVSADSNERNGFLFISNDGSSVNVTFNNNTATAENNGQNGLAFDVLLGSNFSLDLTGGSFSNNGLNGSFSGVRGLVDGAGSTANVGFDGTLVDNNTLHGFEFLVQNEGMFVGSLDSTTSTLSASGNVESGVSFRAIDAGTVAALLMSGDNQFNFNGVFTGADGIDADGTDVDQFVVGVSGSANSNGGDGVNIAMTNVGAGAIDIASAVDGTGAGISTIDDNLGDGIDIDLVDSTLTDITVNGTLVSGFNISDYASISRNGGAGIDLFADNTDLIGPGQITGNTVAENGGGGILVNLTNGSDWDLTISNNNTNSNTGNGIDVRADSGTHVHDISGNTVVGNSDNNIFVDYSGTAVVEMHVDNNTVDGDGIPAGGGFTVGTNFLADTINESGFIPPDTMGGVGPDHVVELINGRYSVYDKDGNQLFTSTLNDFWLNAGLPDIGSGTFDPRIIYDPTVNRWFATSIDGGNGNSVYIGVSLTDDPLDGWQGVRFVGDESGQRFNDFDTLAVDADGLYLATNNFGGPSGFDVSVYTIPKADLLGPVPTVANVSRFVDLDSSVFGSTIQPAVDFGPSDGSAQFISNLGSGSNALIRLDIADTGTPTATLGAPTPVAVPNYFTAPNARQPGAPPVENVSPRINGNVVEVGDSLWAVHAVLGSSGNSAIRWYEIDAVTNTVIQTGLIEDPNLDFLDASIAVNPSGEVVIGYSGSGPAQFISSMASFGQTDGGGTTTFAAPTVLQAGVADYFVDFGSGRNRWGDYSATVLDPTDPNTFWTFQELVVAPDTWGVQITEINFDPTPGVPGTTANDGIFVTVRDTAQLVNNSSVNGNNVTSNGNHGIHISLEDTAEITSLDMVGNSSTDNGSQGILFDTAGTPTLGSLNIAGPGDVTGNGDTGIDVRLTDVLGTPDVTIDDMNASDNAVRGISLVTSDTPLGNVSVSGNTASGNLGGQGVFLDINNSAAMDVASITVDGNTANDNADTGIDVLLDFVNLTGSFSISDSPSVMNNEGAGISTTGTNVTGTTFDISRNNVMGSNGGDGIRFDFTDSTIGTSLTFDQNVVQDSLLDNIVASLTNVMGTPNVTFSNNMLDRSGERGLVLVGDTTPLGNVLIDSNTVLNAMGNTLDGDGMLVQLTDSPVSDLTLLSNQVGTASNNGVDIDLVRSAIANVLIQSNLIGQTTGSGGGSSIDDSLPLIRSGFTGNTLAPNDDGSTGSVALGFTANFFGQMFSNAFVNNNGNITFNAPLGTFTPFDLLSTATPIIAPFFADVDTGAHGMPVTYDTGTIAGRPAFVVNWIDVDYFNSSPAHGTQLNTFQLVLIDRGDVAAGDFDIEFNYGQIVWETGDASGGTNGLGGSSARAGFANGVDTAFELAGSAINGAFLDSGPAATSLIQNSMNSSNLGRYVFFARSGGIGGSSPNMGDGLEFNAADGSNIGAMTIDQNTFDTNGAHGVDFVITDSTLPDGTTNRIQVTDNMITENGGDGFRMVNPDTNGGGIAIDFDGNTITDNMAGPGINLSFNDNAGDIDTTFTNNDVSGNGEDGISLAARESITVAASFDGNTIGDNGELGVHVLARDNVALDLDFGQDGTIAAQNVMDNNVDAGIGIQLFNNVTATLDVANTAVSNTTDGGNTVFDGDGLRVITNDTSTISGVTIGDATATNTSFNSNAARGISFEVGQGSSVMPVTIQNVDASSNGDDGIQFVRFADAVLDNISITDSTINGNGDDGVGFDLQGGGLFVIDASITGSELDGNSGNGINLNLDADVRLLADIGDNEIFNSGLSGIRARTQFDSQLDGTWHDNFIRNSGTAAASDGILIQSTERSMVGQSTGLVIEDSEISGSSRDGVRVDAGNSALLGGLPAVTVTIRDNTPQTVTDTRGISGNAGSGVNLIADSSSVVTAVVDNNFITGNGQDGLQASADSVSALTISADGNLISENGRDGVNLTTDGSADLVVALTDNQILRNTRRGVSLVNQNNADTVLTIDGTVDPTPSMGASATSRIEQNGEVGVYIENNAGALNTDNDITLTLTDTAVIGNGTNTGVTADNRNGVWIRSGTSSSGQISATVQRNFLSGNGNVDFVTESFVATPNPAANSPYTTANEVDDPLARLGIIFESNVGDQIDLVRQGAFYTNADNFKSPLAFFDAATRRRNAQRLALDFPPGTFTDPFPIADTVQAAPAPSTTQFAGSGAGEAAMPNNTFEDLGVTINGQTRNITAYTAGNNQFTVAGALGAAPTAGDGFSIFAENISGVGRSTFRTTHGTLAAGGNTFTNIISDFSAIDFLLDGPGGNPDDDALFGNTQVFEWSVDATPFTFEP
ncbi:nidogen-like domain-containing protein [Maioricimonas rarisocia]|uniref:nidogen-like domain-containing protein n=1 Tax=Maioricimonas rarisocia TaxID=2528026 RepID=UPI0011AA9BBD|nr:nidogen-like domain-containing protein [Maioricimonas rarisocia]